MYLDKLWEGTLDAQPPPARKVRADLAYLRPAAVVAVTGRNSALERYLATWFGPPTFGVGRVLAWRLS